MRLIRDKIGDYKLNNYQIWDYNKEIGYIKYKVLGRQVVVGFFEIEKKYRKQGYGYKVLEYLMKKYPTKSIVGESLSSSSAFWRKCIKKYDGQKRKEHYCDNCHFSFIIPKQDISEERLLDCLQKGFSLC